MSLRCHSEDRWLGLMCSHDIDIGRSHNLSACKVFVKINILNIKHECSNKKYFNPVFETTHCRFDALFGGMNFFLAKCFLILTQKQRNTKLFHWIDNKISRFHHVYLSIEAYTLQETNVSHLGKRNIIFKNALGWDIFVPRRVQIEQQGHQDFLYLGIEQSIFATPMDS